MERIIKKWKPIGYYSNVKSALVGILRHELFMLTDEERTIRDVITKIEELEGILVNNKDSKI